MQKYFNWIGAVIANPAEKSNREVRIAERK